MNDARNTTVSEMSIDRYEEWLRSFTGSSPVSEVPSESVVWRYDSSTYKYIGAYELQEDPLSPGSFLEPDNITRVEPIPEAPNKEIYWNPNTQEWYYKENIHTQTWYNKTTGDKGGDVREDTLDNFTNIPPKVPGLMTFNSESNSWEWQYDKLTEEYKRSLEMLKYEYLNSPVQTSFGEFNGVDSILTVIRESLMDINLGATKKGLIRNYANEMLELNKKDLEKLLGEIVTFRDTVHKEFWTAKDTLNGLTLEEKKEFFNLDETCRNCLGEHEDSSTRFTKEDVIHKFLSIYLGKK